MGRRWEGDILRLEVQSESEGEIDNDSGQRIEDEVMMDSGFRFWEAFGSWASFTTFILDILYHVCKYQWKILNQASCPFREIVTCIVG